MVCLSQSQSHLNVMGSGGGVLFVWVTYTSPSLLLFPCFAVLSGWMSPSLPCDSFLERYITFFPALEAAVPL